MRRIKAKEIGMLLYSLIDVEIQLSLNILNSIWPSLLSRYCSVLLFPLTLPLLSSFLHPSLPHAISAKQHPMLTFCARFNSIIRRWRFVFTRVEFVKGNAGDAALHRCPCVVSSGHFYCPWTLIWDKDRSQGRSKPIRPPFGLWKVNERGTKGPNGGVMNKMHENSRDGHDT